MLMGQAHELMLMGRAHESVLMGQAREEFRAWIHRIRSPKTQINENRLELGPRQPDPLPELKLRLYES